MSGHWKNIYQFKSAEEIQAWNADVLTMKHVSATVNDAYPEDCPQKYFAFQKWVGMYNVFVHEWTLERTPGDIVAAREDIVTALEAAGYM